MNILKDTLIKPQSTSDMIFGIREIVFGNRFTFFIPENYIITDDDYMPLELESNPKDYINSNINIYNKNPSISEIILPKSDSIKDRIVWIKSIVKTSSYITIRFDDGNPKSIMIHNRISSDNQNIGLSSIFIESRDHYNSDLSKPESDNNPYGENYDILEYLLK